MPKPIRVGLIGYGKAARTFHLPFILPNKEDFELVAIYQRSPPTEGKQHCTVDFPDVKWYSDLDKFLADEDVELVLVITPHRDDAHYHNAKAAVLANKHVVVEKPFTNNSKHAEELIELKNKSGKLLFPFQNRRYDSDFLTLQKLVTDGALGEMVDVQMHYDIDFPPWVANSLKRAGPVWKPWTGMTNGIGCHTIDQALTLFGPPATVFAHNRTMADPSNTSGIEDTFDIYLTYPPEKRGLVVQVQTAVVSRLRNQLKYFARGRDGTFIKFGQDMQEDHFNAGIKSTDPAFGVEPEDCKGLLVTSSRVHPDQAEKAGLWEGNIPTEKGDWHGYYRDVARAIRGDTAQYATAETARNNIRIIELARQSWESGKRLEFD
ncbi:hypothetical protein EHS25_003673 [Saitozyma podzolica]|uniref:Gfo/Idh/MocA-like oxidoreductase N-terminal domain-containing protein n=1 Tax=Saitozyma podzolica TaxID=1890683 RepID=A0A427Y7W7_9TREE|nr:hypothetical protein EHS25_003673 [Saitozyma podzolica]